MARYYAIQCDRCGNKDTEHEKSKFDIQAVEVNADVPRENAAATPLVKMKSDLCKDCREKLRIAIHSAMLSEKVKTLA